VYLLLCVASVLLRICDEREVIERFVRECEGVCLVAWSFCVLLQGFLCVLRMKWTVFSLECLYLEIRVPLLPCPDVAMFCVVVVLFSSRVAL